MPVANQESTVWLSSGTSVDARVFLQCLASAGTPGRAVVQSGSKALPLFVSTASRTVSITFAPADGVQFIQLRLLGQAQPARESPAAEKCWRLGPAAQGPLHRQAGAAARDQTANQGVPGMGCMSVQ
jgi:hypothetical protein